MIRHNIGMNSLYLCNIQKFSCTIPLFQSRGHNHQSNRKNNQHHPQSRRARKRFSKHTYSHRHSSYRLHSTQNGSKGGTNRLNSRHQGNVGNNRWDNGKQQ